MGYEYLLLLPLVFFSGLFLVRHAEKVMWKLVFLVFMVLFFLVFFFIYPSPVVVDTYAMRVYWRGPTNNLDMSSSLSRMRRRVLDAVGIQAVEKASWTYDAEYVDYAERDRKEDEGR